MVGPVDELEQRILESMPAIERWFRLEWMEHTPPFYTACPVRNTGFKLAPLVADLFPSGWNHLADEMLPLAVQAAMAAIEKICPEARNLLIIAENQWQESAYLANLAQLQRIFNRAGLNVRIGSISPDIDSTSSTTLEDGTRIVLEPVLRDRHRLGLHNFDPCTLLLNNALRAGAPGILEELHEQYLLPPLHAGANVRRKDRHLQSYEEVAKRLAKMLGIDPWLISPIFTALPATLFAHAGADADSDKKTIARKQKGIEALHTALDATLTKVRRKYKEYGIHEKPFVVLKANGSGVDTFTLHDVKTLDDIETFTAWLVACHQQQYDIIVQEGLPSQDRIGTTEATPVVYMMDRYVVGGFYHVHQPPGRIAPLTFEYSTQLPQTNALPGTYAPNRFYMNGVIARLAMLAASYELEATDPEGCN